jgi:hypothetical protein
VREVLRQLYGMFFEASLILLLDGASHLLVQAQAPGRYYLFVHRLAEKGMGERIVHYAYNRGAFLDHYGALCFF